MPNIIMLGPPGSGKGTLAAEISRIFGVTSISIGDELRHQVALGTLIGKSAESYMNAGKLVPDEIILQLLDMAFANKDLKNGYLLDGFPRSVAQGEALDGILLKNGKKLDKAFFLNVPRSLLISRLANRLICPECGAVYNKNGREPKTDGVCDVCGTELTIREDDKPEVVGKRIDVYNELTKPLVEYYKKQGILVEIDGSEEFEFKLEKIIGILKAV
jgi:adenylate kinase